MTGATSRLNRRSGALTVFGLGTAATSAALAQIEFDPPRQYDGPSQHAASADLNGDGHLDAAVATTGGVQVLFNTGDGTLVHEITLLEGANLIQVQAGDVDGDGHVDLVMLQQLPDFTSRLHFFYNSGDGRNGELHTLGGPALFAGRLAIADWTGNGQLDVIVNSGGNLSVAAHRGRGNYVVRRLYEAVGSRWVSDIVAGDFDGDGDMDVAALENYAYDCHVVIDARVVVLLNQGSEPPLVTTFNSGVSTNYLPTRIAAGDLDGSGAPDFIIVAHDYSDACHAEAYDPADVSILLNDGGGGFRQGLLLGVGSGTVGALGLADFDSDGSLDIVLATIASTRPRPTSRIHILRNRGGLEFDPPVDLQMDDWVSSNQPGDFDGDGQLDLLTVEWQTRILLFRNATLIDNPLLSIGNLVRGQAAEFLVTRAEPGETVHFLYSLAGQGNSLGVGILGGITLDLLAPIINFGAATANAQGEAALVRVVPPNAPLRPVTFQSIIRRGPEGRDSVKSPFQVRRIED